VHILDNITKRERRGGTAGGMSTQARESGVVKGRKRRYLIGAYYFVEEKRVEPVPPWRHQSEGLQAERI